MRMRSAAAWFVVLLAATGFGQNNTQDTKLKAGDRAADFEAKEWMNAPDTPSLVELRGMTVVILFFQSVGGSQSLLLQVVNLLENSQNLGKSNGVMVLGLTDAKFDQVRDDLQAAKVLYPIGFESSVAKDDYGITAFPSGVIVDPDGNINWIGTITDANTIRQQLATAVQNFPPTRTHPVEARVVLRKIEEAKRHIAGGRYHKAFLASRQAVGRALFGDQLKSEAFTLVELLEAIGFDQLAEVDTLLETNRAREAARVLRRVKRDFRGLDCAKDAKARYELLHEEDDAFRAALGDVDAEIAAGRLLMNAVSEIRARRFGRAYDLLQSIMTDYKDTQAATEYAQGILQRMKENKLVWSEVRNHQAESVCRQWLAQSKALIRQNKIAEARELLNRLLDRYDDTRFAAEAKDLLKNILPGARRSRTRP